MKEEKVHIDTTIEDFARLIANKKATSNTLKNQIKKSAFKEEIKKELLIKLSLAEVRIHKSLTLKEILFYVLIPSRKLHGFSKKYSFHAEKERQLGFKRKVNQYYGFSILGHFLYMLIFLIIVFKDSFL